MPLVSGATVPLWSYLADAATVVIGPQGVRAEALTFVQRAEEDEAAHAGGGLPASAAELLIDVEALLARLVTGSVLELPEIDTEGRSVELACLPVRRYAGDLRGLAADLRTAPGRSIVFLGNSGRAERLRDVLVEDGLPLGEGAPTELRVGALSQGFELGQPALRVLADGDIFPTSTEDLLYPGLLARSPVARHTVRRVRLALHQRALDL